MDYEKILNEVEAKLCEADKPAYHNGSCVYQDPKGHRCAVGHLLTDNRHLCFNGSFDELIEAYPALVRTLNIESDEDQKFFQDMQEHHDLAAMAFLDSQTDDEYECWSVFVKNAFNDVRKELGLKFSE